MQDDKQPSAGRPGLVRRLATIMMADVFGYSRMMAENEERTVETLRGHREIFDELLTQHHGRVFNTAGDAILAEFPSAVEAVRCATEIQTALRTRNEHLPPEQRMLFRIGINLGDVIVQGGDLLGDGVNVAARIQTIAEPGGVCLSGSVYDQIRNKLSLQFKLLGERSFKNIAEPVRTFSVVDVGDDLLPIYRRRRFGARAFAVAGIAIVLLAGGAGGYWMYHQRESAQIEEARIASEKEASRAAAAQARIAKEAQRDAELQRMAKESAEREAALRAQLAAAQSKAEQERITREAAQREAKLQADLKAAQTELQFAESAKKQAALLEQQRAETSAKQMKPAAAAPAPAAPTVQKTAAAGKIASDRIDGNYSGRMCSQNGDDVTTERCWPVQLTVEHGAASGSWVNRITEKRANIKGAITPEGAVNLALDSSNQRGKAITGALAGTWSNDRIAVTGQWQNGISLRANWALGR